MSEVGSGHSGLRELLIEKVKRPGWQPCGLPPLAPASFSVPLFGALIFTDSFIFLFLEDFDGFVTLSKFSQFLVVCLSSLCIRHIVYTFLTRL